MKSVLSIRKAFPDEQNLGYRQKCIQKILETRKELLTKFWQDIGAIVSWLRSSKRLIKIKNAVKLTLCSCESSKREDSQKNIYDRWIHLWKLQSPWYYLRSWKTLEFLKRLWVDLSWVDHYEFMMFFLLTKRSRRSPCGRNIWEFCSQTKAGEVAALRRRRIPLRRTVAMARSETWVIERRSF